MSTWLEENFKHLGLSGCVESLHLEMAIVDMLLAQDGSAASLAVHCFCSPEQLALNPLRSRWAAAPTGATGLSLLTSSGFWFEVTSRPFNSGHRVRVNNHCKQSASVTKWACFRLHPQSQKELNICIENLFNVCLRQSFGVSFSPFFIWNCCTYSDTEASFFIARVCCSRQLP